MYVLSPGVDLGQLLLQSLDHIYAVAYPLTVSERHTDQQLARKTLHDGIMKRAFSGDTRQACADQCHCAVS